MAIYHYIHCSFIACLAANSNRLNSYLAIDIILCVIANANNGIVDIENGIVCIKNDTVCTKNGTAIIVYPIASSIRGPTFFIKHAVSINRCHCVCR